nr:DUF1236 domain-containing protein [Rhizobium ruizarguesonis]
MKFRGGAEQEEKMNGPDNYAIVNDQRVIVPSSRKVIQVIQ